MGTISNGVVSPADDSVYVAYTLAMQFSISKALEAALKLGIPEILANAGEKKLLSADEILAQLPTKSTPGPNSVSNLQRLLTPLVREGLFSESLNGDNQPLYGPTKVSRLFLRGNKLGVLPTADLIFSTTTKATWDYLDEAILDETTTTFTQAHGVPVYEYMKSHPEYGQLIQNSMTSQTQRQLAELFNNLLKSGVLDGVNTLVDVGGGRGPMVGQIVAHMPHIQGINFDLPYVIGTAPAMNGIWELHCGPLAADSTSGVQHAAGNFFEAVPSGDAMILKYIIHMFNDEDAIKILQICFKALPKNGKVILAEYFKTKNIQSARAKYVESLDLMMLGVMKGGRERTEEEYKEILLAAGFQRYNIIHNTESIDLMEAFKE